MAKSKRIDQLPALVAGKILKCLRTLRRVPQDRVGGMNQATISRIESGKSDVRLGTLIAILRVYDTSLEKFGEIYGKAVPYCVPLAELFDMKNLELRVETMVGGIICLSEIERLRPADDSFQTIEGRP